MTSRSWKGSRSQCHPTAHRETSLMCVFSQSEPVPAKNRAGASLDSKDCPEPAAVPHSPVAGSLHKGWKEGLHRAWPEGSSWPRKLLLCHGKVAPVAAGWGLPPTFHPWACGNPNRRATSCYIFPVHLSVARTNHEGRHVCGGHGAGCGERSRGIRDRSGHLLKV